MVVHETPTSTETLITDTLAFWQPRVQRELTGEDARQIVENLTGFFGVLERWQQQHKAAVRGLPTNTEK